MYAHEIIYFDNNKNAIQIENAISNEGSEVVMAEANVLSKASMKEVRGVVLDKFGHLDIHIERGNLPGATIGPGQTIFDLSMDDFTKVTELNLNRTVIPSLVLAKSWSIKDSVTS